MHPKIVLRGLDPRIHAVPQAERWRCGTAWIPVTSTGMTRFTVYQPKFGAVARIAAA